MTQPQPATPTTATFKQQRFGHQFSLQPRPPPPPRRIHHLSHLHLRIPIYQPLWDDTLGSRLGGFMSVVKVWKGRGILAHHVTYVQLRTFKGLQWCRDCVQIRMAVSLPGLRHKVSPTLPNSS